MMKMVNYQIHTDAINENLIPEKRSKQQVSFIYANIADVLNVALFGKTAKQWRDQHPDLKGNISDHATLEQLVVRTDMEKCNANSSGNGAIETIDTVQSNGYHTNNLPATA